MKACSALLSLAVLAGSAYAQSSSSASGSNVSAKASSTASASSSSSSSVIPSGISASCSTFLTSLNSDSTLSSCVTPLLTATNAAATSGNSTALANSLDTLCAATGCSNTFIRSKLTDFYGNCSAELADESDDSVRNLYDILYTVVPLKEVVCTKDSTSGDYCVTALSSNVTSSASNNTISTSSESTNGTVLNAAVKSFSSGNISPAQFAGQHLSTNSLGSSAAGLRKRAQASLSTDSDGTYPNATTYRTTNLPYLFIQPSDGASVICSSCAKAVFTAYATWETQTTYALGLSESPILGGQSALWTAAQTTCGKTWINGIVNAATTSSTGASADGGETALSGAGRTVGGAGFAGLVGALAVAFFL